MALPARLRPSRALQQARNSSLTVLGAICLIGYVVLAVISGGSLMTPSSIRGFLAFLAVPVLIGLAQMVTLCVGQMNLAVGGMGGFASAMMAVLMQDFHVPVVIALVIGLAVATGVGFANGAIVVITKINGFIVTLATMSITLGFQFKLVHSFTVDHYSPALKALGNSAVGGLMPTIFLVAMAAAVAVAFFFRRTLPGRRMLAYGGNPVAARLSGISEPRTLVLAHTLSGLLIGIAAMVSVASLAGINRSVGGDWLLPSFAAPIIGGVLLTGGSVAVLGTVLAAVLVRLIDTAHAQFKLDPNWVSFTVGLVVLGTVLISTLRARSTARRLREQQRP